MWEGLVTGDLVETGHGRLIGRAAGPWNAFNLEAQCLRPNQAGLCVEVGNTVSSSLSSLPRGCLRDQQTR